MRIIKDISVALINTDRWPIGLRTLELVKHLEKDGSIPPIHVKPIKDGRFQILDGRHRLLATKLLGQEKITARWGKRQ